MFDRWGRKVDWERAAAKELQREYDWILAQRRITLKRALIAFFDSKSLWGQWDSQRRTIFLSRDLLTQYSWFKVLGVLKHEMAHQLVAETNGEDAERLPHGPEFKAACERLGVPAIFSTAKTDLRAEIEADPACGPGEGIAPDSVDTHCARRMERVKKLLALATSSNEHEALLAMEKVRELYAKYQLSEQPDDGLREKYVHLVICEGKQRLEAHKYRIIVLLTEHFFVRALSFGQYHAQSGQTHQAFEIIGTRENVAMAEYVYGFLVSQIEWWLKQAKLASKKGAGPKIHPRSFRMGVLAGFDEKLEKARSIAAPTESQRKSCQSSAGRELSLVGQALEHFKKDANLAAYMAQVHPRLHNRSGTSIRVDAVAFKQGHSVGLSLTLHKAISERKTSSAQKLLLGRSR